MREHSLDHDDGWLLWNGVELGKEAFLLRAGLQAEDHGIGFENRGNLEFLSQWLQKGKRMTRRDELTVSSMRYSSCHLALSASLSADVLAIAGLPGESRQLTCYKANNGFGLLDRRRDPLLESALEEGHRRGCDDVWWSHVSMLASSVRELPEVTDEASRQGGRGWDAMAVGDVAGWPADQGCDTEIINDASWRVANDIGRASLNVMCCLAVQCMWLWTD